jgi:hypothetical protein
VLQGTLDTFGLPDVLTLLAHTAKSGRLHLAGDRGTGSIWFDAGEVVGALSTNVPLDADLADVVFELLRHERGEFAFHLGEAAPEPGPPQMVAPLLQQASEQLDEWRQLTAVIPTMAHRITLVGELADEHVTLDREQWRTVLAVGAGTTAQELGETLGTGEVPALRRICELLDRGLVEVIDPITHRDGGSGYVPVEPEMASGADDPYPWSVPPALAEPQPEPEPEPEPAYDASLLEQLGGLSPRAAQAVSDVTRGGSDSVLLSFLREDA